MDPATNVGTSAISVLLVAMITPYLPTLVLLVRNVGTFTLVPTLVQYNVGTPVVLTVLTVDLSRSDARVIPPRTAWGV